MIATIPPRPTSRWLYMVRWQIAGAGLIGAPIAALLGALALELASGKKGY